MSAQVAADLRAAADVLERDGWTQKQYHSTTGCHCAVGALRLATGYDERDGDFQEFHYSGDLDAADRVYDSLVALRRSFWPQRVLDEEAAVAVWNDQPQRTADEVIAALRAAADRAEAGQ